MRFRLLALVAGAFVVLGQPARTVETDPVHVFYIGTYTSSGSKGIYTARFNDRTGTISNVRLAATAVDPSFLALHPRHPFLYAVNEGSSQVSSFAVAPDSGQLKPLNQLSSGGAGPCHLAVDRTGRVLLVANYGGGSFASISIRENGELGNLTKVEQFAGSGPNRKRQESPHAHFAHVTPDNRFVLVTDLGTDRIMIYHLHPETASVEPDKPPFAVADSGAGPRHLVFSPDQRFAYVLNEINSTVTRYAYASATGTLTKLDSVSTLPPGFHSENTAAEIVAAPSGKWLMVSNRGDDSIVVFHVDSSGALHQTQRISSGGRVPRSFTFDPSGRWLLAANQESGNIATFEFEPASGRITAALGAARIASPVCLLFGR